jgi:pantoate kinase
VKLTAKAFAPGAISSFFEIHDTTADGIPLTDLERVGARGGGFGLQRGVNTKVTLEEAAVNRLKVFINSQPTEEAKTTENVIQTLLSQTSGNYEVTVEHQIDVPIGMGFGTSAGGALTAGLAFREALAMPLTYTQIGKIAHISEIKCQTGLGTVSSLTVSGGVILVTEPGSPGICQIDRIPISPDYVIVAGFYNSKIPKNVLSSPERKVQINCYGKKALKQILADPTLENFLASCWNFAQKAGFATENTRQLVNLAKKTGAVGATQNMIGEAVHAVVLKEKALSVAEAFKQVLPNEQIITTKIDFQRARLVGHEKV